MFHIYVYVYNIFYIYIIMDELISDVLEYSIPQGLLDITIICGLDMVRLNEHFSYSWHSVELIPLPLQFNHAAPKGTRPDQPPKYA